MAEVTWNLGGLGPDVQETAREAARRSGLTVAEWLQTVILESAADEGVTTPHPAVPPMQDATGSSDSNLESLQSRLEQLSRQLGRLTRGEEDTSVHAPESSSAEQSEFITALRSLEARLQTITQETIARGDAPAHELSQALNRINKRLDFLANEGLVTSGELERRIAAVDRVLSTLNGADADDLPRTESIQAGDTFSYSSQESISSRPSLSVSRHLSDDADPAYQTGADESSSAQQSEAKEKPARKSGLEYAIAQIEARQRALDGASEAGTAPEPVRIAPTVETPAAPPPPQYLADDRLSGLEHRLQLLSQQLDALHGSNGFEDAINSLREDLSDISQKITDAAPRRALEAIETEVRTLGQRIDLGRDHGADTAVLAGIERGLQQVRDILKTLAPAESLANVRNEVRALHSLIEAAATSSPDSATLRQIQTSIADLRGVAARAASGEALIVLAEEVQILGDKVDRFVGPSVHSKDALASLDRRFHEFAEAVQTQQAEAPSIVSDNVASVIETLSRKLDQTEAARGHVAGFEQIAQQLKELGKKLEAADARLGNLDAIENGLSELFAHFDTFRETAITAARAAHEVAAARGQVREGDVDALKQDIDSLRQSQHTTERKTQDTLEAVHGTLERMVERLALIEKSPPVEPRPHPQHDAPYSAEALTRGPLSALQAPPTVPREGSTSFDRRPDDNASGIVTMPPMANAMAERRPIDPSLPADTPLEPGTGASRGRTPVSPAERIAASEAVLGGASPGGESDSKANFIAAARRAAQAAANMSTPVTEAPEAVKTGPSRFGAIAQKFTGRRLLTVGLAIFVAGGSAHILVNVYPAGNIWRSVSTQMAALHAGLLLDEAKKKPVQTASIPAASSAKPGPATPLKQEVVAVPAVNIPPASTPAERTASSAQSGGPERAVVSEPKTTATVSPLTIASIKLPSDVTGSLGKASTFNQLPAELPTAEADADPRQLPASFGPALKAAAIAEKPAAEYEIGMRYAEGRGVPVNLEEAARWLERAANRDIVPAQYRLGSLYEKGQGVKKNLEKARRLYRSAADRGNAKAMHNLAVLHAEGVDGKPDFKSAAQWFRKGAEGGVSDSQYNLGIIFARGLGIEQNLSESYKWFALAAAQGDADAGKKRDDVAARLDQQALEIAKLAVQSFTPEPQPEEAVTVKGPPDGWDKPVAAAGKGKPKSSSDRRPGGA